MRKSLLDTYIDELRFLIALKESVSILNNRIHDKLALVAIEKLRAFHPELTLHYDGAGAGGIDIRGFSADGVLKLVAEVKTTHTTEKVKLRGPQKKLIEADLRRLVEAPGNLSRYLVVISEQTKNAINKQLNASEDFATVEIIDAVGLTHLPSLNHETTDD